MLMMEIIGTNKHLAMFIVIVWVMIHVLPPTDATVDKSRSGIPCQFESHCVCYTTSNQTLNANCSYRNFNNIPSSNNRISSLDLSHNYIGEIEEGIFTNASAMISLDLSYNKIHTIYSRSLDGLTSLVSLNLKGNKLLYKKGVFREHCFRPVKHLKNLNIEDNIGFYTAGQVYPMLSDLNDLENLTMDGVQDQNLVCKLKNLTHLRSLKMSNFTGICVIQSLEANSFENTPNLTHVEITSCSLKVIEKDTFSKLRFLRYLDLSHNVNLHFEGVKYLAYDLQFTSIKILKINNIYDTFHINIRAPYDIMKYLKNTTLQELHLDSNRIQLLDRGVLPALPKTLSFVSAADNAFTFGIYIYESLYINISTLNISNLYSTHDIATGHINKRSIHMTTVKKWNRWLYSMITKDERNIHFNKSNVLKSIRKGLAVNPHIPVPRYLNKLYINRCLYRFIIPQCTLLDNSLEYLDGSENLITEWIGPVFNLNKLKHVDLSSNFCSNISSNFFQNLTAIETLIINTNLLGFVIPFDIQGHILFPLRKLKIIDLSLNRIDSIPKYFFRSQSNLENLNLSSNMLEEILFDVSGLEKLSSIDLSNNRITSLRSSMMEVLDEKTHNQNFTLDLSNNPLQCTCETIDFVKWFTTTKISFRNKINYQCTNTDKTKSYLKYSKDIYRKLSKQCSNYRSLIAAISVALILFAIILIIGMFYRYRWKLRYMYYMTKQKYRDYDLIAHDFIYDAFISYADEDQDFVHGEMIVNLEDKFDLKLCLHKRDFIPGQDIAVNITNAIHNSRKTVVVLSRHFLNSYWCMFEFNMARMESIYSREKERIVLLILYEHIPVKDLPLILLEHVQSESFIEYPHDNIGNAVFWMKMKETLQ